MRRSLGWWPYAFAIVGVLALVAVLARGFLSTTAQDGGVTTGPAPHAAFLGTGTCDALETTSGYELEGRSGTSGGERVGSADAAVITYSLSKVPVRLDVLISAPYAIAVLPDSGSPTEWVACGDVGGFVDEEGMSVGLRAPNGSGLAGVAILWDAGNAVEVELYLAADLVQAAATPPAA